MFPENLVLAFLRVEIFKQNPDSQAKKEKLTSFAKENKKLFNGQFAKVKQKQLHKKLNRKQIADTK